MKPLYSLTIFVIFLIGFEAIGQTNPAAQSLPYTQDFSALAHSSTTFPEGWQGWNLSTSGSSGSFRTTAPISDLSLTASSSASTTSGGVHNFDGKIGFTQTGSSDPSICISISTSGKTGISVAYDVMTMRNSYNGTTNTRINELTLQYRVGTSGSFTSLTGIEYQNNTTAQTSGTIGQNIQNKTITLPIECEGQSVLQLRWAARNISGAGSRPGFAVDNIDISFSGGCPVLANFSSDVTSGCIPLTVNFTDLSIDAITYSWKEDEVTFSANADVSKTFNTAGAFTIKLIASDGTCSDSISQTIIVTDCAPLDYTKPANWLCHPMKSAASDPSTTTFTYAEYNADGSTGAVQNIPNNNNTNYDVFFLQPTGTSDGTIPVGYMGLPGDTGVAMQDTLVNALDFVTRVGYFTQFGRVYAPNYRKASPATFSSSDQSLQADVMEKAANDVIAAFQYYLTNNNNGKKIILVGHSQGSIMIMMMLRKLVDNDLSLQDKILVAVTGGLGPTAMKNYVSLLDGTKGGWLENIPLCENQDDLGCVMSWATWQTGQTLPTVSSTSLIKNPNLVTSGFLYQQYVSPSASFKVKDDPIGFGTSKTVSGSLFPASDCGNCVAATYAYYTDMYTGSISESSNTAYNFSIETTQDIGDVRPDPAVFNSQMGYHTKDFNIPAQDIIDIINAKICKDQSNSADAGNDTTICVGQPLTLAPSGGASYVWNASADLSCTSCENPIATPTAGAFQDVIYYVTATTANGCTAIDSIIVTIDPCDGQVQYKYSDYAIPADTFLLSRASLGSGLNFDTTGTDLVWDYSTLIASTQNTKRFETATGSGYVFTPVSFHNSLDLAESISDTMYIGSAQLYDSYNFYDKTSSNLSQLAFATTIEGVSIKSTYDSADVVYKFPLRYGNAKDSSNSGYSINLSDYLSYVHSQERVNEIEGWGEVRTPYGTFDALKIKSVVLATDSFRIDTISIPSYSYTTVEYKWLNPAFGVPLLKVSQKWVSGYQISETVEYLDSLRYFIPNALFAYYPTVPVEGDQIQFQNLSTNATTYSWNFGDTASGVNNTSASVNPSHVFANPGTYQVTLIASNPNASDTVMIPIVVSDSNAVVAAFSASILNQCIDRDTIEFVNLSLNEDGFIVDFGDGNVTQVLDTSVTSLEYYYDIPGTYEVKWIAINGSNSDTATKTITVAEIPVADFMIDDSLVGQAINFINQSSGINGNSYYYWDFGFGADPGSSTIQTPITTYSFAGNKTVVFYAYNSSACYSSVVRNINILNSYPLTADAGEDQITCLGDAVALLGLADFGTFGYTYSWSPTTGLDDPNIENPSANPAVTTTYVLTVTDAENNTAQDSVTISVVSTLTLNISISASDSSICEGDQLTFDATVSNGGANLAFDWKIDNVSTGETGPTYQSTGLTNGDVVTCIVTSQLSCATNNPATSNSISVIVNQNPSSGFVMGVNSVCENQTDASYSASGFGGSSFTWSVPDGATITSGDGTDMIYVDFGSTSGNVSYVETTTAGCKGNPYSIGVSVNPKPNTSSVSGDTAVCENQQNVSYAVTNTSGSSYTWLLPTGANISSGAGTNAIAADFGNVSGSVRVVEVNQDFCLGDTVSLAVVVNATVTPAIGISASAATICSADSVEFIISATNEGSSPQYLWFLNGVSTGNTGITYTSSGLSDNDSIMCQLISSESCVTDTTVNSDYIVIDVNQTVQPSVSITVTPSASICDGEEQTFTANATNEGINPLFQWYVNEVSLGSGSSYATSVASDGDIIYCTMESSESCVTDSLVSSNNFTTTVFAKATPTVSQSGNVLTSSAGASYQWFLNDTLITGANAQTYTATVDGSYSVEVTDVNGCAEISSVLSVTVSGVGELPGEYFTIYPNPNSGNFTIVYDNTNNGSLEIFNAIGQVVYYQNIKNSNKLIIDLSEFGKGVYFAKLKSGDNLIVKKVIVE